MDPRAKQLADLVLDYSVNLQPNDRLLVQFDPAYSHYATLIGGKAKEKGAEVVYDSISYDPKSLREFIKRNDHDEWKEELERRNEISRWCNSRILVHCDSNPNYSEGIKNAEERVSEFNKKVVGPYKDVLYRKTDQADGEIKWNITGFPHKEGAKSVGMSLQEYENFVYSATLTPDWVKMGKNMGEIKKIFNYAKDVHIIVPGQTDLHLSLEGRGGRICEGKRNMPDGEIFYGPVDNSINGTIYFQCPTKRDGLGVLEGIGLEFENGIIKKFSAKRNQNALEKTLEIDEGAKKVGELGIGCNYGIKQTILETLFDEKIGGTIHLALGDSFRQQPLTEGGGLNKSNIHWDIICDLRRDEKKAEEFPGGQIFVDGNLVQENGKWKI